MVIREGRILVYINAPRQVERDRSGRQRHLVSDVLLQLWVSGVSATRNGTMLLGQLPGQGYRLFCILGLNQQSNRPKQLFGKP